MKILKHYHLKIGILKNTHTKNLNEKLRYIKTYTFIKINTDTP